MEYLFLIIIIGIGIFNLTYALEVSRIKKQEGFIIPQYLHRLLKLNIILPAIATLIIFLLLSAS